GERAANCTGTVPIATGTDCDDTSNAVNRAAREACNPKGVDENCNGTVDEGCACEVIGSVQPCCSGRGTQTCELSDAGGSVLTACSAVASMEVCNGIDDDCDGAIDEDPDFTPDGGVVALDGGIAVTGGDCVVGVG